jgi:DNA-binding XRE family transcriptional regulator
VGGCRKGVFGSTMLCVTGRSLHRRQALNLMPLGSEPGAGADANPCRLHLAYARQLQVAHRSLWRQAPYGAKCAIMMTAAQCRMARAALRWEMQQLADKARISRNTVIRLEGEQGTPIPATLTVIRQAFEAAGVEFIPGGVRLREPAEAA